MSSEESAAFAGERTLKEISDAASSSSSNNQDAGTSLNRFFR